MFLCLLGCFRDCLQFSLLINFCPPWNHQKTIDSLMISGTIEAKLFACILSVLKVKFRDDTLPLFSLLLLTGFSWHSPICLTWAGTCQKKDNKNFFPYLLCRTSRWLNFAFSKSSYLEYYAILNFFSGSLRVRDSGIRLYVVKIAWRICSWIKVNRNTNEIEKREMCFIFFMFLVKSVLLSPLYGLHYFQNTIVLHGFKSLVKWVCSFLVLNFQIFVSIVYSLKILFFKFWYSL